MCEFKQSRQEMHRRALFGLVSRAFAFQTRPGHGQRDLTIFPEKSEWKNLESSKQFALHDRTSARTEVSLQCHKGANGIPQKRANKNLHFTETLNTPAFILHRFLRDLQSLSLSLSHLLILLFPLCAAYYGSYCIFIRAQRSVERNTGNEESGEIAFLANVSVLDSQCSTPDDAIAKREIRGSLIEKSSENDPAMWARETRFTTFGISNVFADGIFNWSLSVLVRPAWTPSTSPTRIN